MEDLRMKTDKMKSRIHQSDLWPGPASSRTSAECVEAVESGSTGGVRDWANSSASTGDPFPSIIEIPLENGS